MCTTDGSPSVQFSFSIQIENGHTFIFGENNDDTNLVLSSCPCQLGITVESCKFDSNEPLVSGYFFFYILVLLYCMLYPRFLFEYTWKLTLIHSIEIYSFQYLRNPAWAKI